ncbi:terminase small subunit [Escherichia coli]|nr:terminase small subunit [Escherichia coli]MDH7430879.1 terminase small subunit [Escherichia coli]WHK03755.1 terminase small subunit [Escherichia coli]
MEVNKKQLADIFGASIRTIQNWQEQGMPVLRGGGKRDIIKAMNKAAALDELIPGLLSEYIEQSG